MGNLHLCGCSECLHLENLGHTEGEAKLEGATLSRRGLEEKNVQGKNLSDCMDKLDVLTREGQDQLLFECF